MRDLGKLNRDLSKVMLVTCDPDAFYLNPENAIKVRPEPRPGDSACVQPAGTFRALPLRLPACCP